MDSGSCLPIPSACQKCCSASQLFSLESAIALAQNGLKHQAHLVCPSLQPGLVPSYYLVSSLMPSNIRLIFYAAFLVVLRGKDYPYCLGFLLQKPKSMACLKKGNIDFFNCRRVSIKQFFQFPLQLYAYNLMIHTASFWSTSAIYSTPALGGHCRFVVISALSYFLSINWFILKKDIFLILWAKKWEHANIKWSLQDCWETKNLCLKEITSKGCHAALHSVTASLLQRLIDTLRLTAI